MGLSHRFDQVLSFVFGHVTRSCSCAPAIAGVRWIRSSVQVRFFSRLTIERLEGHACAVAHNGPSPRRIGYVRVSSFDQNPERRMVVLLAAVAPWISGDALPNWEAFKRSLDCAFPKKEGRANGSWVG